jgi:prephenate dehydratase
MPVLEQTETLGREQTDARERPSRVAFQGERGAFSEEAAVALLGAGITLVPCPTFEEMFASVGACLADYALAPIENSLVGTIVSACDLLLESPLVITREVVHPVAHNLVGCNGATLEGVRVVESHPAALAQCEKFFAAHRQIKRVAADDTAASVRRIVERGDPERAAIASMRAARLYGGTVLLEHLEDHRENYTRFVLLAPPSETIADGDKISLALRLPHRPGALYQALEPLARRRIDLLKIESRPVRGEPWQYRFYVELQGATRDEQVACALAELQNLADEVRVLGCYPTAGGLSGQGRKVQHE